MPQLPDATVVPAAVDGGGRVPPVCATTVGSNSEIITIVWATLEMRDDLEKREKRKGLKSVVNKKKGARFEKGRHYYSG